MADLGAALTGLAELSRAHKNFLDLRGKIGRSRVFKLEDFHDRVITRNVESVYEFEHVSDAVCRVANDKRIRRRVNVNLPRFRTYRFKYLLEFSRIGMLDSNDMRREPFVPLGDVPFADA